MGRPVPPWVDEGMVCRSLRVPAPRVQLVKGLVEAWEGVANVFGERGGDLTIAAPADRESELDAMLAAVDELLAMVDAMEPRSR
jgi:hypothetical protein